MHRVELKGIYYPYDSPQEGVVPNAPCGVESCKKTFRRLCHDVFLMHRVELKVGCSKAVKFRPDGS